MLLVLEIGLTIAAWRRGWKAWALLPLAITAGLAYMSGLIIGLSGGSIESALAIGLVFDLACIGALTGMVVKPRREVQPQQPGQPRQATEVTAVELR